MFFYSNVKVVVNETIADEMYLAFDSSVSFSDAEYYSVDITEESNSMSIEDIPRFIFL